MHDKGYAHRDLKLENCFMSKDLNVKVADFGFSSWFGSKSCLSRPRTLLSGKQGTRSYMAPELYTGR